MQSMKKRQFSDISPFVDCVKKVIATDHFKEIWCTSNKIQKEAIPREQKQEKEVFPRLKPMDQFTGIINSLLAAKEDSEKIENNQICMKSSLSVSTITTSGYKINIPHKGNGSNNVDYLGYMEYKSSLNSRDILKEKLFPKKSPKKLKEVMELYNCVYCGSMRVQQVIVPVEEEILMNIKNTKVSDDSMEESVPSDCVSEKSESFYEEKTIEGSINLNGVPTRVCNGEKNYLFTTVLSDFLEDKTDSDKIYNPFVCESCIKEGFTAVCRVPDCLDPIETAMLCKKHATTTKHLHAMTKLERDALLRKIQKKHIYTKPPVIVENIFKENSVNAKKRCTVIHPKRCRKKIFINGLCKQHYSIQFIIITLSIK